MTDHHVALFGDWSLWRWFALRAPGFSADLIEGLGNAGLAEATDAWLARARELDAVLETEIAAIGGSRHRRLVRAREALAAFDSVTVVETTKDISLASAAGEAHAALVQLLAAYDAERVRIHEVVRERLRDPRIREAIAWQNRGALALISKLLDSTTANHKTRERELTIANYVQRYSVKNDTIGFFGPICLGELVDSEPRSVPGPTLLAARRVYFEHWGIDLLAAQLSQNLDLLLEVAPRRIPSVRLEGSVLHHGLNERSELPDEFATVMAACDGIRSAREIAEALAGDPDEVYEMLEQLRDRKAVCWQLDVPTATAYPERVLASLLERAAEPARGTALALLGELTSARDRVAAAAGDSDAVARALEDLEQVFTRVTGREAVRHAGQMYAGRTLVYEDTWRDHELRLGSEWRRNVGGALALALTSARWYTHAIASGFRGRLEEVYRELSGELGTDAIDYPRFYERFADHVPTAGNAGAGDDLVAGVQRDLHARWSSVLALDPRERRVERRSEDLAKAVAEAFAVPGPGWPAARLHSPDLMIAAHSTADALAGRGTFVLGELHTGYSTLTTEAMIKDSPNAAEILRAERRDTSACRVGLVGPKSIVDRTGSGPTVEMDYDIELGTTRSHLPRDRVLAAADLVVRKTDGVLSIGTRDGRVVLDPIAFFETVLRVATIGKWSLLGPEPHTPRVTIDNLVVVRERWRFATAELDFLAAKTPFARFAGVRRWVIRHGLPRRVFAKFAHEAKPVYIDLASALYIELLAKLARQSPGVTISEMMPALDELWLADGEQRRYTAEVRVCAVDSMAWQPPTA